MPYISCIEKGEIVSFTNLKSGGNTANTALEIMSTSNEKTILKFHIGRGGQFHNSGHVTFIGEEKIGEGIAFQEIFYDENQKCYCDNVGNPLHDDLTENDIETGIGRINIDHDFDTTYTTYSDELSDKEKCAIATAQFHGDNSNDYLEIDPEIYDVLEAFGKVSDFVKFGYTDLEDVNIEECDEEDEEMEVNGKFYRTFDF